MLLKPIIFVEYLHCSMELKQHINNTGVSAQSCCCNCCMPLA